ncbi:Rqc2 family fibronectin-binding protein [Alkalibacter mobilis]|uniref:Rqc2 family fibronectin-binding protein n=1 Tax=Alkalibacter mobilis TaxID=2787712 RepID=UPI00189D19CC|nr:NFACT RNA binding domain-containing protein [Alkalibacter mobilis]MBF7095865.1 NFACT family protein [Alkalibacter mobilis]
MALDGIAMFHIASELENKLSGGKINKIYQPETDELIFNVLKNKNKYNLLVSANSSFPRIHLISTTKDNPASPPMFCMLLRKKLMGGIITSVKQLEFDRIIEITVSSRDELMDYTELKLVVEIMGRHSNVILIENNIISDSIKRINKFISSYREVLPGREYILPPMGKKDFRRLRPEELYDEVQKSPNKRIGKVIMDTLQGISKPAMLELCTRNSLDENQLVTEIPKNIFSNIIDQLHDFINNPSFYIYSDKDTGDILDFTTYDSTCLNDRATKKEYSEISSLLEDYYKLKDSSQRIKQRSASINQLIGNKLERDYNKLDNLNQDRVEAENAEKFKVYGDLIFANLYNLSDKTTSVDLYDYYSDKDITIPLDIRLTPAENAKKYYDRYNKQKRALTYIDEQMQKTLEEIYYLESVLDNLEKCTTYDELNEIKEELAETGFLKSAKSRQKKSKTVESKPMVFKSSENFTIYVGKNNKQNDLLTLKSSSKDDLWFHVKDIPGSHVIVKTEGRVIGEKTIEEAAVLAAYYSKAKMSANVPVDYTQVKYVKKPKGSKAGMVIYTDNKTIFVTPDEKVVKAVEYAE